MEKPHLCNNYNMLVWAIVIDILRSQQYQGFIQDFFLGGGGGDVYVTAAIVSVYVYTPYLSRKIFKFTTSETVSGGS